LTCSYILFEGNLVTAFDGCIDDRVPAIRGSKNFLVIIVMRAFVLGVTKEWIKVVSPC